jgi:hypothetical protein
MTHASRAAAAAERCDRQATIAARAGLTDYARQLLANAAAWRRVLPRGVPMTRPTRATRELACLALGHQDTDADSCPTSDDELMRHLIEEVQRLRVAAGEVEETATDRADAVTAIDDALDAAATAFVTGPDLPQVLLDQLVDNGWRLDSDPRLMTCAPRCAPSTPPRV